VPDPRTPWNAEAFAALAMSHLARAFWADQAAFAISMTAVHSNPSDLSETQLAQRKAILSIASKIMIAERDKAMDEACGQWRDYRISSNA
jgi:hypothetical protein